MRSPSMSTILSIVRIKDVNFVVCADLAPLGTAGHRQTFGYFDL